MTVFIQIHFIVCSSNAVLHKTFMWNEQNYGFARDVVKHFSRNKAIKLPFRRLLTGKIIWSYWLKKEQKRLTISSVVFKFRSHSWKPQLIQWISSKFYEQCQYVHCIISHNMPERCKTRIPGQNINKNCKLKNATKFWTERM